MTFRKSLFFISIVLYYALIFPVHSFSATGSDNYSLKFDGGDRVVIPDSPSLNPSQITVETWVYLNRLAPVGSWDNQFLISKGNDQTQGSYYLSANRDQFHFYLGANGVDQVHAATPSMVKTNRWYHVAGTYDGVNIKIYVNGVLQGTTPASITIGNTGILSLGYHDLPGSEYYLDGNLDDVRIWNVARTQGEIQADMLRTLTGSEPGLAGYWPMDEGSGQIVGDASGNGNNGQIGSTAGEDADDPAWILTNRFQDSLQEDFETGAQGWIIENGEWEMGTPTPTVGPGGCYNGTQCAATNLSGNYAEGNVSRLISPQIQLPEIAANDEIHLRFQQWVQMGSYDTARVTVQYETAPRTWSAWESLATYGNSSGKWAYPILDLSNYAGKKIRIGFLLEQSSSGWPNYIQGVGLGWYIDDVVINVEENVTTVLTPPDQILYDYESGWGSWYADNGQWEVGAPTSGPGGCYNGTQCAATNLSGNYAEGNVSRLISPQIQLPEIAANDEIHLRFQQWVQMGSYDTARVTVQYETAPRTWSAWESLATYGNSSGKWAYPILDLSNYAGKKIRIGFLLEQSSSGWPNYIQGVGLGWYIDDVKIVAGINPNDLDGDGMPNDWETSNGLDPNNPDDAGYDDDNDGLSNLDEFRKSTDPNNPDTDGDGLPDGWEVKYGLDPKDDGSINPDNGADGDPDGDGLTNIKEFQYGFNPRDAAPGRGTISPDTLQVSIGGINHYQIIVTNSKATREKYTLSVEGLDPSWYTLSKSTFKLLSGEDKMVSLDIHIPEPVDCGIPVGDHPFSINITPTGAGPVSTINATLTVLKDPVLSAITPADGEAIGSNRILFSWKSDAPGSTEVSYRKEGDVQFAEVAGVSGTDHTYTLEDLSWDMKYEWYVQTQSVCGLSMSMSRTNSIEKGIVFDGEPYEFFIERDYEQVASINVRNTDTIPHELLLALVNDNEDLIAGFRGDGSTDERIILQPGETQSVEVAFHAQDATKTDYSVLFRASADTDTSHPIISFASAAVHVHHPVFNFSLVEINTDPFTLTNTFRLTNNGDPVTDMRVDADEESRPFMTFSPIIEHLRLGTGESIEFKVMSDQEMDATIIATGAEDQLSINTHFGCAAGTNPFKVPVDKPQICREVRGGYCTNRPNFEVPFTLPAGLARTDVDKSALYTNFIHQPGRWSYRPHDVDIKVNKKGVLSLHNTIPEGPYSALFPPSFLNYSIEGGARNAIQVQTRHMNGGHYVVITDFDVVLALNKPIDVMVCAADEEDAKVKAQEKMINLSCGRVLPEPCPRVVDVRLLDPDTGAPKNKFLVGDRIRFEVNVINPDSIEHIMDLGINMDENPADLLPAVQNLQHIVVPGDSSNTYTFDWTITNILPTGKIFVSISINDASCQSETPYAYSFSLGVDITPPVVSISDEGVYSVDNESIFADWFATDPESGITEYAYRIGTAPCDGDVQDWTVTPIAGPRRIPASLTYGETYYVCTKATNSRGLVSGMSTNGITILDPLGDPDGDRFTNEDEVAAKSNPFNSASFPGNTTLFLHKGFNLVSFPAETLYYETLTNLMKELGGNSVVSRILVLDPVSQTFAEGRYNNSGNFYGQDISLLAVQSQVGMIIYAKMDALITFTSTFCPVWELYAGTNIVGSVCMPPRLNSFQVMGAIGDETLISTIQRFNYTDGRFETSNYSGGVTNGTAFSFKAGEGYFVFMKQGIPPVRPETLNFQGAGGTECVVNSDCIVTGCSGQVCASEPVITTCEWREEYACYHDPNITTCGCNQGTCGWAQTPELEACLGEI